LEALTECLLRLGISLKHLWLAQKIHGFEIGLHEPLKQSEIMLRREKKFLQVHVLQGQLFDPVLRLDMSVKLHVALAHIVYVVIPRKWLKRVRHGIVVIK
jgi:hypothetical protein